MTKSLHVGRVKLEIDFGNRPRMEAQLAEVESIAAALKAALSVEAPRPPGGMVLEPCEFDDGSERQTLAQQAGRAIDGMGDRFTSSDIYSAIPEVHRSVIKDTFRKLVDGGRLKIIEEGSGSRPTIYEKTPQYML